MAQLNARTESFIALLLSVSGRARPTDLQGVDATVAAEMLHEYAAVHSSDGLGFEGDALVHGQQAVPVPAPAPAPVPAPMPAPAAAESFEFGPADPFPSVPDPAAGVAQPVPASDGVTWDLSQGAGSAASDAAMSLDSDFIDLPPLEGVGDAADAKEKRKTPLVLIAVVVVIIVLVAAVVAAGYFGVIAIPGITPS